MEDIKVRCTFYHSFIQGKDFVYFVNYKGEHLMRRLYKDSKGYYFRYDNDIYRPAHLTRDRDYAFTRI